LAEARHTVRQTATNEDLVIDWSLEEVTPEYFADINQRRSRELGIKEKYGLLPVVSPLPGVNPCITN